MTNSEMLEVLRDIVVAAQEGFVGSTEELLEDSTSEGALDSFVEACSCCIDDILMAAEMTEMNGLKELCAEMTQHTRGLVLDVALGEAHGQRLTEWTTTMLAYLEEPSDHTLARKLLEPLPEERREGLFEGLTNDWPGVAVRCQDTEALANSTPQEIDCPNSTEAVFPPHDGASLASSSSEGHDGIYSTETIRPSRNGSHSSDFPAGEYSSVHPANAAFRYAASSKGDSPSWQESVENVPATEDQPAKAAGGMIEILIVEISDVEPQLSKLLDQILASDDDNGSEVAAAAARYQDIVGRIIAVADSLGLAGLQDICTFISENVERIAEPGAPDRARSRSVLADWPSFVLAYLRAPADDQRCLELVRHLQDEAWPQPYEEEAVHAVLESLTVLPLEAAFDEDFEARQTIAQPEDVSLKIADDLNPELVDAFFQEAPSHAAEFSSRVERLIAGEEILVNVEAAQRLTHTIKGSANLVGASGIANLAHNLEDILEYLAKNRITPPEKLGYTLQESADRIETMLDAMRGLCPEPPDSLRVLQDVLNWANQIDLGSIDEGMTRPEETAVTESEPDSVSTPERTPIQGGPKTGRSSPTQGVGDEILRVPTFAVDKMFRLVGETSIAIGQVQEHLKRLIQQGRLLREHDNVVQRRRFELENLVGVRSFAGLQRRMRQVSGGPQVFDSLELDQYDELYGTAHSFIEAVTDSRELSLRVQGELSTLEGLFLQQQNLNKELQQMVMATRMVPVGNIVSRLQRSVRQACRATGKTATLEIQGTELLLDSEVLGRLVDPLTHVLRNSIDHGIESGEERSSKGKPVVGRLVLRFSQDGNDMVVYCSDDGRGLDYDRIRDVAVQKGLLEGRAEMPEPELARLALLSGFSTRDAATQISGRGVGLDVVHNTIIDLKGSMEIGAGEQSGCLITLRLPITLITNHVVLIRAANEIYAVPTGVLEQILPPNSGQFARLGNSLTYQQDNVVYPARFLGRLLNIAQADGDINESKPVLLVRTETERVALAVDEVVDSYDVVVKGLGRFVKNVRGISGVSTLGDGRVVAVLDVPALLRHSAKPSLTVTSLPDSPVEVEEAEHHFVLIVDDSLSVRKSLADLVADGGYEPLLARDGLEAIDMLRKQKPKIVLADLEMPNMNGLELTSHIRADQNLRELPVIMITSRTQQKHRDQAKDMGVSAYLTKPYSEDELLDLMGDLVDRGHQQ